MNGKMEYVKQTEGYSNGDIRPKRIDTSAVTTVDLTAKNAIIDNLDLGTLNVEELTLNGSLTTTDDSTTTLLGTITINEEYYVSTVEALKEALVLATTNGGLAIHLAPGIFVIDTPLVVPNDTDIIGSGPNTTILQCISGFSGSIVSLGNRTSLQQLQISGNNTGAVLININGSVDLILNDLILKKSYSQFINIYNSSKIKIRGITFQENTAGGSGYIGCLEVKYNCSEILIESVIVKDSTFSSETFFLLAINSDNVSPTVYSSVQNFTFKNCIVESCSFIMGIFLFFTMTGTSSISDYCNNITFSDFTIKNCISGDQNVLSVENMFFMGDILNLTMTNFTIDSTTTYPSDFPPSLLYMVRPRETFILRDIRTKYNINIENVQDIAILNSIHTEDASRSVLTITGDNSNSHVILSDSSFITSNSSISIRSHSCLLNNIYSESSVTVTSNVSALTNISSLSTVVTSNTSSVTNVISNNISYFSFIDDLLLANSKFGKVQMSSSKNIKAIGNDFSDSTEMSFLESGIFSSNKFVNSNIAANIVSCNNVSFFNNVFSNNILDINYTGTSANLAVFTGNKMDSLQISAFVEPKKAIDNIYERTFTSNSNVTITGYESAIDITSVAGYTQYVPDISRGSIGQSINFTSRSNGALTVYPNTAGVNLVGLTTYNGITLGNNESAILTWSGTSWNITGNTGGIII